MNTQLRFSATNLAAVLILSITVSACSGILSSEQAAKQYYTLMPYGSTASSSASTTAPELAIAVTAVPGLDTDRIQALGTDARLQHYANARWPDHLPEVLTSVMRRSLLASGRFSAVKASARTADGGWELKLEVQQFYGIRNSSAETSSVLIEMAGELECNDRVHQFILSDSTAVKEERLSAVVAAHQASLDEVSRQLLARTAELCSPDQS